MDRDRAAYVVGIVVRAVIAIAAFVLAFWVPSQIVSIALGMLMFGAVWSLRDHVRDRRRRLNEGRWQAEGFPEPGWILTITSYGEARFAPRIADLAGWDDASVRRWLRAPPATFPLVASEREVRRFARRLRLLRVEFELREA